MQAGRLIEVIIYIKHHLGPLIGGRLIERYFIVIVLQIFWDFDMRPFNRGWPLKRFDCSTLGHDKQTYHNWLSILITAVIQWLRIHFRKFPSSPPTFAFSAFRPSTHVIHLGREDLGPQLELRRSQKFLPLKKPRFIDHRASCLWLVLWLLKRSSFLKTL